MQTNFLSSFPLASLYGKLFASASVTQTTDGALQIASAPGRYIAWILAFIMILPLSLWCWRRPIGGHFARVIFFASFAIPIIVVPGIALESVHVSPDFLTIRTGFWFSPTIYQIPLAGLHSIIEQQEEIMQRGVPRHDTLWRFRYRSGEQRQLDLPDLLDANRTQVIEYFRQHGIPIKKA